jgi:hypothetical protein
VGFKSHSTSFVLTRKLRLRFLSQAQQLPGPVCFHPTYATISMSCLGWMDLIPLIHLSGRDTRTRFRGVLAPILSVFSLSYCSFLKIRIRCQGPGLQRLYVKEKKISNSGYASRSHRPAFALIRRAARRHLHAERNFQLQKSRLPRSFAQTHFFMGLETIQGEKAFLVHCHQVAQPR